MLRLLLLALTGLPLIAQPTVAPTPEQVGSPRGENKSGYNIQNSFELGYRWRTVDGNYGKYRSDVNFGNGIRLLGSSLRVNSLEGHGGLFDEIVLTTQGIGNDPYQSAVLRIQKNKLYRYDMLWRLNEYYNPGLTIANGQHLLDTRRRFQDHDFTLFPQSSFKLFLGYSRNTQTGPGLSTVQVFESRGDEFPLFYDVNRRRNEWRLGGEAEVAGFKLNVLHGWDRLKEDSPLTIAGSTAGNNPADNTTLSQFERHEPYEGDSPYWRILLFRNEKRVAVNARYTNVSGSRDFVLDESAIGSNRIGAAQNRQVTVAGRGSRPVVSGGLNLTFLPTDRITLTNHTAFSNVSMDGNATYREFDNGSAALDFLNFQHLGIRTIETLTDATIAIAPLVSVYGGYHYSTRRIRSREGGDFGFGIDEFSNVEQNNRLHSGLGGVRLHPAKGFTFQFDGEIGRADHPFYPISEKHYYAYSGRFRYKTRSVLLASTVRQFRNTNSVDLFTHSSRSSQFTLDMNWTAGPWLSLQAGYSNLNLDTATGLAYFAGGQFIQGQRSLYYSNLHTGIFGAFFTIGKRADFYAGYSIVRDTGLGRSQQSVLDARSTNPFFVAQTFPLTYQSPQARLSVRVHNRLRWNAGYQFYGYREDFFMLTYQNYRAHTGYTSLLWSF